MFKFFIKMGSKFLGTNSKKVADGLVKQGGTKVKKPPSNVTVKKAPTPTQPRSPSTGRMQTNSNPPAARKTTAPKIVRNKPNSLDKPKKDNTPAVRTSPKKPAVQNSSPKQGSSGASYSRVNNPPKAKNDSKIVGVSPMGKAALGAASLAGALPSVNTESRPKKKAPARTAPSSMPIPKKKTETPVKKTETPKKGPMTLTKYLNDEIKKRDSTVTAQKKGAEKHSSIAAAKKAGSLYYKNKKSGKIMAAVYKEDLSK